MALTGAQVKQLRSMAHHLNPAIIIGKSDVNEGTVEQTVAYLEKHELVKCSVLDGSSLSAREAAEELAEQNITPSTIRLSIGTENIDDIIQDLDEAFKAVQ